MSKKTLMWTCDVCRTAKFEDFGEACRHEEECKRLLLSLQQQDQQQWSFPKDQSHLKKNKMWTCDSCQASCQDEAVKVDCNKKQKEYQAKYDGSPDQAEDVHAIVAAKIEKQNKCLILDVDEEKEESRAVPKRSQKRKNDVQMTTCNSNDNGIVEVAKEPASSEEKEEPGWLSSINNKRPKRINCKKAQEKHKHNQNNENTTKENVPKTKVATFFAAKGPKTSSFKKAPNSTAATKKTTATAKTTSASTATTVSQKGNTLKGSVAKDQDFSGSSCFKVDSRQTLFSEQRMAEFQAQRLEQQQRERERQRKRVEALQAAKAARRQSEQPHSVILDSTDSNNNNDSSSSSSKTKKEEAKMKAINLHNTGLHKVHSSKPRKVAELNTGAPQFPNPTHVFPADCCFVAPRRSYRTSLEPLAMHSSRFAAQNESFASASTSVSTDENRELPPLFPSRESPWAQPVSLPTNPVTDIVSRLVSCAFKEGANCCARTPHALAEKYRLSRDDLEHAKERGIGTKILEAAKELCSFVEDWKSVRRKANQRAAERQRNLVQPRRKRIKRRGKNSCKTDNAWLGSDDDDDEIGDATQDTGLSTLMLITGPVASGKTSLVHAVTAQCDCQVLEINSSDKRSGAALKQMLQEATQSHSSVDLWERENEQQLLAGKLVDSDSDDEEDSQNENEKEDEDNKPLDATEKKKKKGAKLAVILIDEVDLLYEEDSGFWATLTSLSKRTKSPIVLTANSVPNEIRALRYNHIVLERPELKDCVARMEYILDQEGIMSQEEGAKREDVLLQGCAKLLHGDLRRFCHELQSTMEIAGPSKHGDSLPPSIVGVQTCQTTTTATKLSLNDSLPPGAVIVNIAPAYVLAHQYSLVTLSGTGFLSLASSASRRVDVGFHARVHIGGCECPAACILDDETALAVCPPFDNDVNIQRADKDIFDSDADIDFCDYVSVSLASVEKRGSISTTQCSFSIQTLGDGTKVASIPKIPTLELRFSCKSMAKSVTDSSQPDSTFLGLMKEGVDAWKSRNPDSFELPSASTCKLDVTDMEEAERKARMASDAAILETGLNAGLPFLAGACRGLGFEMTGESHMHSNEKSDALGESRLFDLGWKEDCFFYGSSDVFMCTPLTLRERRLFHKLEQGERGQNQTLHTNDDDDDNDNAQENEDWRPQEPFGEDCFLPHPVGSSILDLPLYLFSMSNARPSWNFLESEQLSHYEKWNDLFHEVIFYIVKSKHWLFARGLTRNLCTVMDETECIDRRLVLDYVPILRRMAVFESAAERSFKSLGKEAGDNTSMYRRTTRSRKLKGREHYFEDDVFTDYFDRRNQTNLLDVNEMTNTLCSRALCVEMPL